MGYCRRAGCPERGRLHDNRYRDGTRTGLQQTIPFEQSVYCLRPRPCLGNAENSGPDPVTVPGREIMKREGFTLWFTGWSGAGKTTLAIEVERCLRYRGVPYVQRLDGDIVRQDLTRDLGFSRQDRDENIRRVTFVASLLSGNGVATLVSFISPYREARGLARERCHRFVEIYMKCSPEVLAERDVKGY